MSDHEVSDEQLHNYKIRAQAVIDEGGMNEIGLGELLALELIIQLCDVLLNERHPKPLFENLWYQGVDDEREIV